MRPRPLRALAVASAVLGGLLASSTAPASGAGPQFDHLRPGAPAQLVERLPVNVVLLGYDAPEVDAGALRRALPASSKPIVRSRAAYGIREEVGVTFRYEYDVRSTGKSYENRFFAELKRLSQRAPLTAFQQLYNDQEGNSRVVRRNTTIDAPSVERWLAMNPPAGVDTRRNTVFLIDWSDRGDFEHHVYTKTGEPDPDTGYDFGKERDSRKLIAWGGTTADDEETGLGATHRVWFHDASAGPESWAGSWNVDDADLDGDGEPDYRIPPVWEYGPGRYRAASALTGDLARLVRYVAVDLLFTPSPLYPVDLPTPDGTLPETIDLDSNTYEGDPERDASRDFVTRPLVLGELRELLPRKELSYDSQDLPFMRDARRCYVGFLQDESCYPQLGYPSFANLFLQNTFQLRRTQDDQARVDYELPIFNYSLPDSLDAPFLGFADDNYQDGTQSYVFNLLSDGIIESGYGLSTTIIHEVGHHVGLSHPHDGYDSPSGDGFGPSGEFFFVWAGDEVNSMMSYIDVNWDFSQFDRDNMDRYQAAAQVEAANQLAARALAGDTPRQSHDELRRADQFIGDAKAALARHDYRQANLAAHAAYVAATEGAEEGGGQARVATAPVSPADAPAAREAEAVHEEQGGIGEFIDSLHPSGPRDNP